MTASLLRRLLEAGTPDDLVDEVAALLTASRSLAHRREADAARKRTERAKASPDASTRHVTSRDSADVTDSPPPNDIISNPPPLTPSPDGDDPLSPDLADRVVEAWNCTIAGSPLPRAQKLSADRRKHLRCRVRSHGEEAVFAAIRGMAQSDFHSGRSGKWTEGNLGWLLKSDENFVKMLERQPAPAAQPITEADRTLATAFAEAKRAYDAGEITFDEMMSRKPKPPDEPGRQFTGPRTIGSLVQRIQDKAA